MPETAAPEPLTLVLSQGDIDLVRAALRLLLSAEDDPETIAELKSILVRLPPPAG